MNRWLCSLLILFIFVPTAYASEAIAVPPDGERILEIRALSYDYDEWSPLGNMYYGTWGPPSFIDGEGYLEWQYSVGEEHRKSVYMNWERMREYWLRLEVRPSFSAAPWKYGKCIIENNDELKIWSEYFFGPVLADGGYDDPESPPIYTVLHLLVDSMEQTDEEILERLKAMRLVVNIKYESETEREEWDQILVNTEDLFRETLNDEEGTSFVVETCEIRQVGNPQYYPVPDEVKADILEYPEQYGMLSLLVRLNKNMALPVYDLNFGAFDDKNLWSGGTPWLESSEGGVWIDEQLFLVYVMENGEHFLKTSCVIKLDEVTETAVLEKLRESSLSAYYSTEVDGRPFEPGEGDFRFGPVFQKKLDMSSVQCFMADEAR